MPITIYEVIFSRTPQISDRLWGDIGWTTRKGRDVLITDNSWQVESIIEDYSDEIEDINIISIA